MTIRKEIVEHNFIENLVVRDMIWYTVFWYHSHAHFIKLNHFFNYLIFGALLRSTNNSDPKNFLLLYSKFVLNIPIYLFLIF